jgi:hypothetical protein
MKEVHEFYSTGLNGWFRVEFDVPESPEGAERPLVPTTRSEEGPGDAEQRSAEGRAVPPGEAEAAMLAKFIRYIEKAAAGRRGAKAYWEAKGDRYLRMVREDESEAKAIESLLENVHTLLPKPDSDARSSTAPHEGTGPSVPHGREEPCDERSGRRNAEITRGDSR